MPMFDYGKPLNRSWLAGTWQVMLLKGTWTPDVTQQFVSGIVASESSGTGYSRKTLTGQTITVDTVAHQANHFADVVKWTGLTCSDFRYAAVYLLNTTDANSVLHSYYDFGQQSITAGEFDLQWNGATSNGIVFSGA